MHHIRVLCPYVNTKIKLALSIDKERSLIRFVMIMIYSRGRRILRVRQISLIGLLLLKAYWKAELNYFAAHAQFYARLYIIISYGKLFSVYDIHCHLCMIANPFTCMDSVVIGDICLNIEAPFVVICGSNKLKDVLHSILIEWYIIL